MNLLKEALQAMRKYDVTEDSVLWAGTRETPLSWERFKELAKKVVYPEGWKEYDDICVEWDLLIVGNDWWLERGLDGEIGSQWWQFQKKPELENPIDDTKNITLYDAETLSMLNK